MDEAMIKKAKRHFNRVDPVMADLIRTCQPVSYIKRKPNPFHALIQTIVNQQLLIKAGQTIFSRLLVLQGGRVLKAEKMVALTQKQIQKCGVSINKTRSIQTIAKAVVNKELSFKKLEKLDDDAILAELIDYPGIGQWSAEIFLMGSFNRPDILPVGDLVLRKSMQKFYSIASDAHIDDYLEVAQIWRPFRTIASRYLWAAYQ